MKAYKAFDKDMKCRDFQYEEGVTYTHEGDISLCSAGFHSCTLPFDCLSYYPLESMIAEVEVEGVSNERREDSKVVSSSLKITKMLSFNEFTQTQVQEVIALCRDVVSSAASSGEYSPTASSGEYSPAASSGYCSPAASSGYCSPAASSGNSSPASSSGNSSPASVKGEKSVACAIGRNSKVRGIKGSLLILVQYDDKWNPIKTHSHIVDGKKIKENTWYVLNGKNKFVAEE